MTKNHAIVCPKGATDALLMELADLGIKKAESGGLDWAKASLTDEQVLTLKEKSQAAIAILELIGIGDREAIEKLALSVKPTGSFCVRAEGPDRQELEEGIGGMIKDHSGAPVSLSAPDTKYLIHESDGDLLFGVDKAGNLSKRHYKIITGAQSLTGPVAYCTLRLAGWTNKKDLVVWPSATGELAIEAALSATGKSPRAYELKQRESHDPTCKIVCADPKLSMVRSCEKNAKVAGVNQAIRFSRQDADWLDTKYEENEVKLMVGLLPNLNTFPKLPKELLYQLDFIMKKGGKAAFLCVNDDSSQKLEEEAKEYTTSRAYIWSGKHCHTLVSLARKK